VKYHHLHQLLKLKLRDWHVVWQIRKDGFKFILNQIPKFRCKNLERGRKNILWVHQKAFREINHFLDKNGGFSLHFTDMEANREAHDDWYPLLSPSGIPLSTSLLCQDEARLCSLVLGLVSGYRTVCFSVTYFSDLYSPENRVDSF